MKKEEEVWESEFFIVRKFFIYPMNKVKLEKFLNALLGRKGILIHNLFIIANIKKCAKQSYSGLTIDSILKFNHDKSIFKKEKAKYTNFVVCFNSINNKAVYLNEKIILNLKINNIRYELGWKFKKIRIYSRHKYDVKISILLFKLIQFSFKIKKPQNFFFIGKFSLVLKSLINNLFGFF